MENPKKVLIVAGEASGDLHAANLVEAIKKNYPPVSFFGLGGPKMKKQGVQLPDDLTKFAVVGFWEVLKNLFKFKKIFRDILIVAERQKPDLAILVDYPGFNLRLANELHKRKIPVVYYISPQIWAWGTKRIYLIKKVIKRMLVFFDFEERLYKTHGIPVTFVGNPLLDTVKISFSREETLFNAGLKPEKLTVCLLPGSREKEVKTLLPVMLKSARIINSYLSGKVQFLILRSLNLKEEIFLKILKSYDLPVKTLAGQTYDGIAASDFALVCSGTATLETAILATPMAILYKVNLLTWLFIRAMIKIPYIGLVNVVRGRKIAEEFIQFDAEAEKICDYVIPLLRNKDNLARLKLELMGIKGLLGQPGANLRAALAVADLLKNKS